MKVALAGGSVAPESLSVVFQPIFEVGPQGYRIHALEALVRGRSVGLESPAAMFQHARKRGEEGLLDRACLAAVLTEARLLPEDLRLCVNVNASTLDADASFVPWFAATARECSVAAERLVVEVVEHALMMESFLDALRQLHDMGVRIALDDLGPDWFNHRTLLECRPDYFKVDAFFVGRAVADLPREAAADSVGELARRFGARAVAKGVESRADLAAVTAAGVDLVQGFLLIPPLGFHDLIGQTLFTAAASDHAHAEPGAFGTANRLGGR